MPERVLATCPLFCLRAGYRDGFATTAPVDSFAANGFRLHDLGGNVWEWCEDKFKAKRVSRGASWGGADRARLRSSGRLGVTPGARYDYGGFRGVWRGSAVAQ